MATDALALREVNSAPRLVQQHQHAEGVWEGGAYEAQEGDWLQARCG